jgi:ABC-2 type transport system permease protein
MFPFEGMPRPAQFMAELLPLTHFLRIVRAITLKGGDFSDVRAELVWLTAIFCALVVLASLRFRKKLL